MTYYMGYRQSGGYGYPPSKTILSITWCQWGERFSTRYPPSSISPTTTLIGRVVCIPWSAMVWVQRRKVSSGSTGRTSSWWLEWGDITSSHWKADALPPPEYFQHGVGRHDLTLGHTCTWGGGQGGGQPSPITMTCLRHFCSLGSTQMLPPHRCPLLMGRGAQ